MKSIGLLTTVNTIAFVTTMQRQSPCYFSLFN